MAESVERFFHDITSEPLRRDAFARVPAIVVAIDEYIAHHNNKPKPFIWNQSAWEILNKVIRANKCLSSKRNEAIRARFDNPKATAQGTAAE